MMMEIIIIMAVVYMPQQPNRTRMKRQPGMHPNLNQSLIPKLVNG